MINFFNFSFILISIIELIKLISTQILSKKFTFSEHLLQLKGITEANNKTFSGVIDITSPFSYTNNNFLSGLYMDKPKEIRSFQMNYLGKNYDVREFQETLNITVNDSIKNFNYYLLERDFHKKHHPNSVFSFGFNIYNELHSITHSLYNNNLIRKTEFGLTFENKNQENDGWIHFGGLPKDILQRECQYNTTIKIDGKEGLWSFKNSYIILPKEKKVLSTKEYFAYFSTLTPYIVLPSEPFSFIINNYLKKYLQLHKCRKYGYGFREYDCQCSIIKEMSPIGFIIGNNYLLFHPEDLFHKFENFCVFQIILNEGEGINEDNTSIIFGTRFLWKFIPLFSYEDKSVMLFSKKPFESISNVDQLLLQNKYKLIFIFIFILLLIDSFILIRIKYINKSFMFVNWVA